MLLYLFFTVNYHLLKFGSFIYWFKANLPSEINLFQYRSDFIQKQQSDNIVSAWVWNKGFDIWNNHD